MIKMFLFIRKEFKILISISWLFPLYRKIGQLEMNTDLYFDIIFDKHFHEYHFYPTRRLWWCNG